MRTHPINNANTNPTISLSLSLSLSLFLFQFASKKKEKKRKRKRKRKRNGTICIGVVDGMCSHLHSSHGPIELSQNWIYWESKSLRAREREREKEEKFDINGFHILFR